MFQGMPDPRARLNPAVHVEKRAGRGELAKLMSRDASTANDSAVRPGESRGLAPHVKKQGGDDVWSEARENCSVNSARRRYCALHVTVNMLERNYTTRNSALQ